MESSGSYQEPGKRLRVTEKPIEKDPVVRKENSSGQSNNNEEYDHPENDIDISSMRVVDLKEELQKRGLETSGLKKVLQQRLQSALDASKAERASSKMEKSTPPVTNDAMEIEAPTTTSGSKTVAESTVCADAQRDYVVQDIRMDDIEKNEDVVAAKVSESEESDDRKSDERAHDVNDTQEPKNLANARFVDDISVMTESTGIDGSQKKKNLGQKLLKATSKLFSPNKNKGKSPMKKMDPSPSVKYDMHKSSNTVTSVNDSSTGSRTQTEEKQDESFSKSKRGLESVKKASGVMSTAAVKRAEEKKKIQAALSGNKGITSTTSAINQKDPISMLKTPAATNMVPSKASGDSKSSSASSETSTSSVASSMKGTASSLRAQAKTKAYADARKARLEEIRGKSKPVALAQVPSTNQSTGQSGKNKSHLASKIAQKSGTGHSSVLSSTNSTSATEKRKLFTEQMREKAKQAEAHAIRAAAAAKKQMEANAMREKAAAAQKQAEANILSPMQTYEMSDREGSDSDDDSSVDEDEAKKKIPAWAQRTNLLRALQKQFDPSVNRYDPDVLFSEVQTCDLTAIFGPSEKRQYRERKSTGNWTNDQVTVAEKLTYKRKMGYSKKR
eukprot:scaffold159160_cov58-Attheya_sp.AAC.6